MFSDKIAEMAGDRFFTIHPRKGHLAILDKKQGPLVQRSMGLIGLSQATSDTKGGGVMRTIDGNVLVGPDAFEQPYREDFSTKRENVDAMPADKRLLESRCHNIFCRRARRDIRRGVHSRGL